MLQFPFMLRSFAGKAPEVHPTAFVEDSASVVRELSAAEIERLSVPARNYVQYAAQYRGEHRRP